LHQKLDVTLENGRELFVATLLPEEIYLKEKQRDGISWIAGTITLFVGLLIVSFFLARNFVKPIMESIENIKSDKTSGISEIDTLLAFIREKEKDKGKQKLPEDIEELFSDFTEKAKTLTPTEKTIIKYYAEGKEIHEIPDLCFISINTVRKHNANIYQKLEIGSREELLLYIELFRRSGRINELF
jgi:DNA-binding CsgD family transcriptional regulator